MAKIRSSIDSGLCSFKGRAPGKLTVYEDDFFAWFDHLKINNSLPVCKKISCTPTENVNETVVNLCFISRNEHYCNIITQSCFQISLLLGTVV